MGIVKISDELHDSTKLIARAMSRPINSQENTGLELETGRRKSLHDLP
ncbi:MULTISPECIES: ParD-like family protein [Legionella]|nr:MULTISPECIES: ParD-like family protein [Legionella]MCP0913116.1 ParD-like family protein [Legionella sp. 27cVA30]